MAEKDRKSWRPGSPYGVHRVLEPKGVLPQAAWKLDSSPDIYDSEMLVDVRALNIDAASFKQIRRSGPKNLNREEEEAYVAKTVMDIVSRRGKMHNPVTGSGGMLLGIAKEFGPNAAKRDEVGEGDLIATLVSLSLTPLRIDKVKKVHLDRDQVEVEGTAIVFASGPYAAIPEEFGPNLALALLDVAGAPVQTNRLVHIGDTVVVMGAGGKSGLICTAVAKDKAGPQGTVVAVAHSEASTRRARQLDAADMVLSCDATDALGTMDAVTRALGGKKADVTINCVNVPGTEMSSILVTKDRGKVYFFSMATGFTAAALGAEGVGADVDLIIGNGYAQDHAQKAIRVLQANSRLRAVLSEMFPD